MSQSTTKKKEDYWRAPISATYVTVSKKKKNVVHPMIKK